MIGSSTLLYEISGQHASGKFPVFFTLNCELPAYHKDNRMMFYKEGKGINCVKKLHYNYVEKLHFKTNT